MAVNGCSSIEGTGRTLLGVAGYKHLASISGFHTHGLAEGRLAGCEITARRAATKVATWGIKVAAGSLLEITTGREVATGSEITTWGACITPWCALATGKAVIKTPLAFVAETFAGRATKVTCAVAEVARTRRRWASTEAATVATVASTKAPFTGTVVELALAAEAAT